ncbi:MAG: hypothetical protein QOI80_2564 [Solirubrobacteraceae bacterium]|nr:hypothetical protein [Solirubrobacteraceae bacterium]
MRRLSLAAVAALLIFAPAAHAGAFKESDVLRAPGEAIALGADGNYWVGSQTDNSLTRVSPDGHVVGDPIALGGAPAAVVAGPGNTIWASVPSAKKLVKLDAMAATPLPTDVSVAGGLNSDCGPVALADGGDGLIYYSAPANGLCSNPNSLGSVDAATGVRNAPKNGFGNVLDLAVSGGKLFAPDYDGDVVRRVGLSPELPIEAVVDMPAASGPTGVTVVGSDVWVTLQSVSKLARFPVTQSSDAAPTLTPPASVPVLSPAGIGPAPGGGVLVAAAGSHNLLEVSGAGEFTSFPLPNSGAAPTDLAPTADGAVVTDHTSSHVYRFADAAPTIVAGDATATSSKSGTAAITVDTHGNATDVSFEYGPSTAYGKSTTTTTVEASAGGPSTVTATINDLEPNTTYHVRAKATNAKGDAVGDDRSFTTNKAGKPTPTKRKLAAKISYKAKVKHRRTAITKLVLTKLEGGETVKIKCVGAGCPFATHTIRNLRAGKRSLTRLFGRRHKLAAGAKITVTVSKRGRKGKKLVLTTRKTRRPKAKRS